jgi:hypothetical protein
MSAMFSSSPESEAKRKADALVAALVGIGTPGAVEPRGSLAVLRVSADVMARLAEPSVRREMIALAKEHGFTHVAVELG